MQNRIGLMFLSMNDKLLIRQPILLDESLQSYLARMSKLNGYPYPNTVERLAENMSSKYLDFRYDKYIALAKLTNQPTHLLIRASVHPDLEFKPTNKKDLLFKDQNESTLKKLAIETGFKKQKYLSFCPKCLENPYHRTHWFHPYTNICLEHQCLLLDKCPSCHKPLEIIHLLAGLCSCNFNLRTSPILDVSNDIWGLTAQIAVQFFIESKISPDFQDSINKHVTIRNTSLINFLFIFVAQFFKDIEHDSSLVHPRISQIDIDSKHFTTHHRSYRIAATVFRISDNWPEGFYNLIDAYRYRNGRESTTAEDDFYRIDYLLSDARQLITDVLVNELFDNFIAANYPLTKELVNWYHFDRRGELRSKYPYLSEIELARLWQVPEDYIQSKLKQGSYIDSEQDPIPWEIRKDNVLGYYRFREFIRFRNSSSYPFREKNGKIYSVDSMDSEEE